MARSLFSLLLCSCASYNGLPPVSESKCERKRLYGHRFDSVGDKRASGRQIPSKIKPTNLVTNWICKAYPKPGLKIVTATWPTIDFPKPACTSHRKHNLQIASKTKPSNPIPDTNQQIPSQATPANLLQSRARSPYPKTGL